MLNKQLILDELKKVVDPELGKDIVSLELIKDIKIEKDGHVLVTMTLTSPYCPLAGLIVGDVRDRIANMEGVSGVKVDLVF